MIKPQFSNNQIYHIYNRGVEKRSVFMEDKDYLRFIHDLFEFNDTALVNPSNIRFSSRHPSSVTSSQFNQFLALRESNTKIKRKLLVEILVFCLMPNHYHLMVRQLVDDGIVKFMQKLGTGYTNYFNLKNERVGSLFQGRFKAVLVNNESYFTHLLHYIHLNPLEKINKEWKNKKIKNFNRSVNFLESYRWSSFLDYIGKKNFPSITQRGFLLDILGGSKVYKNSVEKLLQEMDLLEMNKIILE